MDLERFQNRVKDFEVKLQLNDQIKFSWIESSWFHIEPTNENYSSISIRFEFDEIRIGIDHVKESYSDQYGNGRAYEDGFHKFDNVLTSRIKRIKRSKGNFPFKVDYYVEKNGDFEYFATILTWLFPFWRRTTSTEFIQDPLLTM